MEIKFKEFYLFRIIGSFSVGFFSVVYYLLINLSTNNIKTFNIVKIMQSNPIKSLYPYIYISILITSFIIGEIYIYLGESIISLFFKPKSDKTTNNEDKLEKISPKSKNVIYWQNFINFLNDRRFTYVDFNYQISRIMSGVFIVGLVNLISIYIIYPNWTHISISVWLMLSISALLIYEGLSIAINNRSIANKIIYYSNKE